tara:strand:- start:187 stop:537 length:351 start_codon:yes stop_codon:yes gene_type:complete
MLKECGKKQIIKLEDRSPKFLFGTKNYGDIPGKINRSDGDPWDVIVPGYPKLRRDTPMKTRRLEGVIMFNNGNHKLVFDIETDEKRRTQEQIKKELDRYIKLYKKLTGRQGYLIVF